MLSQLRDTFSQVCSSRKDSSEIFYEKYIEKPKIDHHSKSHQLLIEGLEIGDVGMSATNSTESHRHHIAFVLSYALKQVSDEDI